MAERCEWAEKSEIYRAYHDEEWGVPLHDDRQLFEFLILEGAQAGLSWETILNKRARYREVFDGFDAERVARYGDRKVAALLADAGIVRNRLKVAAAIGNAQAYLEIRKEHGSFDRYIWQFTGGGTVQNRWNRLEEVPAFTDAATAFGVRRPPAGGSAVPATMRVGTATRTRDRIRRTVRSDFMGFLGGGGRRPQHYYTCNAISRAHRVR